MIRHLQMYASILATWNVLASATAARSISLHLTVVTFTIWADYAYRDVWPLMTFTLKPLDEVEGHILWVKIALSTFVGLIEPLFEPHAYIPIDPEVLLVLSFVNLVEADVSY